MIEIQQLSKTYRFRGKTTAAVTNLSFALGPGRILGVLGPNGAGKTSLLRMLATIMKPTGGTAQIAGYDLVQEPREIRNQIGYVPQSGTLVPNSIVGEELALHGQSFGLTASESQARGKMALARVGADQHLFRRAGTLSGGERRRVDLALGTMCDPRVVLLDEPTVGLDPEARQRLWKVVRSLRDEWGATVVMSTHYLDEAEALADEILLLEAGRTLAYGSTEDLREEHAIDRVSIRVTGRWVPSLQRDINDLPTVDHVFTEIAPDDSTVLTAVLKHGSSTLPRVLSLIATAGLRVNDIDLTKGGLDDTFTDLVGAGVTK